MFNFHYFAWNIKNSPEKNYANLFSDVLKALCMNFPSKSFFNEKLKIYVNFQYKI